MSAFPNLSPLFEVAVSVFSVVSPCPLERERARERAPPLPELQWQGMFNPWHATCPGTTIQPLVQSGSSWALQRPPPRHGLPRRQRQQGTKQRGHHCGLIWEMSCLCHVFAYMQIVQICHMLLNWAQCVCEGHVFVSSWGIREWQWEMRSRWSCGHCKSEPCPLVVMALLAASPALLVTSQSFPSTVRALPSLSGTFVFLACKLSGMFRRSASLAIPHRKRFAAIPSVSLVHLEHTNRSISVSH